MTTPRRGLLYHFTHISNLASIATDGLFSDNAVRERGCLSTEVGNRRIKDPRRSRTVPCGPQGFVADYVPFYFAARSPMLGSIHVGKVETYKEGQADLVYLVTDVDRVRGAGLPYVFTDRNAVYGYARFGSDVAQLSNFVDWGLMERSIWKNTRAEPDNVERRMAEFLVREHVPWEVFLGVAVIDQAHAEQATSTLDGVGSSSTVLVRRGWYF